MHLLSWYKHQLLAWAGLCTSINSLVNSRDIHRCDLVGLCMHIYACMGLYVPMHCVRCTSIPAYLMGYVSAYCLGLVDMSCMFSGTRLLVPMYACMCLCRLLCALCVCYGCCLSALSIALIVCYVFAVGVLSIGLVWAYSGLLWAGSRLTGAFCSLLCNRCGVLINWAHVPIVVKCTELPEGLQQLNTSRA